MSPTPPKAQSPSSGFPRVSGDEPAYYDGHRVFQEFSPRERG